MLSCPATGTTVSSVMRGVPDMAVVMGVPLLFLDAAPTGAP